MNEIETRISGQMGEQSIGPGRLDAVPTHVRHLQRTLATIEAKLHRGRCHPAESRKPSFFTALGKQLHPQANAENRCSPDEHRLIQCLHESALAQILHALVEMPDSWE